MPKIKAKTKKALVRRIKVTGTGKVKRHRPGGGHLKSRKSPARLRRLRQEADVAPAFAKHAKRLLGM